MLLLLIATTSESGATALELTGREKLRQLPMLLGTLL